MRVKEPWMIRCSGNNPEEWGLPGVKAKISEKGNGFVGNDSKNR